MNRIRLVIADRDTDYIESLTNYIRNSEYSSRFDVKLFSKKDRLDEHLLSGDRINVLLATTELIPHHENPQIDSIITLSEQNNAEHSIFKYQPLNKLLSQILSIHYEQHGRVSKGEITEEEGTKIITIFSSAGGTGKTTVSHNLSREISAKGYRVFYLNLELINTTPMFFDMENKKSASPLLYYIKTNSEDLGSKVDEMSITDEATNVSFFNLRPSAEEMEDLSGEEVERLLNSLIETESYHYIIVDLDSSLNDRTLTALAKSDRVFWLLNNDVQSFHKTSYLLEELHSFLKDGRFSDRVSLILNRYTGSMNGSLTEYGLNINAYLPYVPAWKEVGKGSELCAHPVFNESVLKLFHTHFEEKRGVSSG